MSKKPRDLNVSATLTDCVRDPGAVMQLAKREGPIVVIDSKGRERGVLCVPTDRRPFTLVD